MKILRVIFVIAVLCAPFYAQQVNTDIVPASPGLYLGHTNQRWNGYFNNADIYNLTINGSPIGTAGIGLPQISIPNGTNCTTLNGLVEFDGNGQAQTASLSSAKVIGVAVSGAGCSGNVLVQYAAIVNCTTDGSTLINDRIAASNSIPGDCMDIGPISIPGIQTVGLVTAVSSGAGQLTSFDLFTGDTISPSSSSGSGVVSVSPCIGPFGYAATAAAIVSWDCNTSLDGSGNAGFKKVTVTGSGAGKIDFGSSTTPGNPSAGFFRLYADSGTGFLTCLNSAGGNCLSSGTAFSAITSGTNTAAAMIVGSGASLKPLNVGQVAGSQAWLQPGIVATSVSYTSNTGGSLGTIGVNIQYTFVSAAGETLPSVAFNTSGAGPCASSSCQATVVAPTIPSGYTGYTVYSCNTASCTPLKQAASANCVNITTNCVISTAGAGAGVPTINTAIIQPANIQAATLVPSGGIPSLFFPKTDGNYYPLAGMDFSSGTPLASPDGTFEFWHRVFVNDSGANIAGSAQTNGGCIRNTLFSICHLSGNVTATGVGNDDRAISVRATDALSSPNYNQFLGYYGETLVYNPNFTCAAPSLGAGEDCIAGIRARANMQVATIAGVGGIVGIHGTASTNVAAPNLASCNPCVAGLIGTADQETVNNQVSSARYAGVAGIASASTGNTGTAVGVAFEALPPSTKFTTADANRSFHVRSSANWDYIFYSDATQPSKFLGTMYLPAIRPTNVAAFTLLGGFTGALSFSTAQVTSGSIAFSNGNIVTGGTPGGTSYTYAVVCNDGNGGKVASATGVIATGNATLTGPNFNQIRVSTNEGKLGCVSWDVYRTVSGGTPSSTGKIGTISGNEITGTTNASTGGGSLNDTGLAGDGTALPTGNTTGTLNAAGMQSPGGFTTGTLSAGVNSNVTPVTVNANVTTDQNLMAVTLPANALNAASRNLHIFGAAIYSTPVASVATITMKVKLCTVSGCGSGTVLTPCSYTTSANPGNVTNNSANFVCDITTQTTGASAAFEAHGNLTIDLGATPGLADSIFSDTNTATVGTIDSTAQLFLQTTVSFSVASASNSMSERQQITQVTN